MTNWPSLLQKPANLPAPGVVQTWFDAIAKTLLNCVNLCAGGKTHRLIEIEFYVRAAEHPDPFTHRDPLQLDRGPWYLHPTNGVYRRRTFHGPDPTFAAGPPEWGVLFPGPQTPGRPPPADPRP